MKLTDNLKSDFFGGLTAAITALPLAIAFGVLALSPLGPEYASQGALAGLYGAIFTGFFASLFGGTPCQVTGPTGPMTTVLTSVVAGLMVHDLGNEVVLTLTFFCVTLAGATQIIFGVLKLGQLIKFIPYPVVAGFMNGIAIIIFMSQVKPFLGLENLAPWADVLSVSKFQFGTIAAGVATIFACTVGKKYIKSVPGALQGLILGSAVYYLIAFLFPETTMGAQIGNIPSGIPKPEQVDDFLTVIAPNAVTYLPLIVPSAIALGVLGAIDSLLTSVVADTVTRTRHDSRKELIGQGIGNIFSGAFGGLAGAGATVRTLVNVQAGGRGRASGMIHSVLLLLTLMVAGPVAGKIPMVVLAGILLVTAVSMVDTWSGSLLLKVVGTPEQRKEIVLNLAVVSVVTIVTVVEDLMIAVAIGIVISVFLFVAKMTKSIIYRITYLTDHSSKRVLPPRVQHSLDQKNDTTLVVELEGTLFFGTTDRMANELEKHISERLERVIIDFRRVKDVDSSGARLLILIQEQLTDQDIELSLASIIPDGPKMKFFQDMGVVDLVLEDHIFPDLDHALQWAEDEALADCELFTTHIEGITELHEVELFERIPKESMDIVEQFFTIRKVSAGEVLFTTGDASDHLFVVRSGTLARRLDVDKTGSRLAEFGSGTVAGEIEFLTGEKRLSYLLAEVDSEVYEIETDEFEELKTKHPLVAVGLMEALTTELSTRLQHALNTIKILE